MALNKRVVIISLVVAIAALAVIYLIVTAGHQDRSLVASGTLEAVEVDVGPLVSGRLTAVAFDEGDGVPAGATVATLDAEEWNAAAAAAGAGSVAARSQVESARAAYNGAEDAFRRIAAAYPGGGVTKAEYERALAARDAARAQYYAAASLAAQAEGSRAQVEARRREVTIIAPLTGIVLSRNYQAGEIVPAGGAVLTLADLSVLELAVYVRESKIGYLHPGDPVDVSVDSFPGEKFRGRVKAIAGRTSFTPRNIESKEDRVSLVFKVTITVPNGDKRLKPGMPADAEFVKTKGVKMAKE